MEAVHVKDHAERDEAGPLVPVHERVVAQKADAHGSRQIDDGDVPIGIGDDLPHPANDRPAAIARL